VCLGAVKVFERNLHIINHGRELEHKRKGDTSLTHTHEDLLLQKKNEDGERKERNTWRYSGSIGCLRRFVMRRKIASLVKRRAWEETEEAAKFRLPLKHQAGVGLIIQLAIQTKNPNGSIDSWLDFPSIPFLSLSLFSITSL
jgi:hypothetical protein